jgi:hypothetical protein
MAASESLLPVTRVASWVYVLPRRMPDGVWHCLARALVSMNRGSASSGAATSTGLNELATEDPFAWLSPNLPDDRFFRDG